MTSYILISNNIVITKSISFMPIINSNDIPHANLINNSYMVYLRDIGPKGLYSWFNSTDVIHDTKSIEYVKLTSLYQLCSIPKLIFVKFISMNKFNNIVTCINYKTICEKHPELSASPNVPTNLAIFEIKQFNFKNLLGLKEFKSISSHVEEEIADDGLSSSKTESYSTSGSESESELSDEYDSDKIIEEETTKWNIPIFIEPCKIFKEKMKEEFINLRDLRYHYNECDTCHITDNNRKTYILNKKINIISVNDKKRMFRIMNRYINAKNYVEYNKYVKEIGLSTTKNNLIYFQKRMIDKYDKIKYEENYKMMTKQKNTTVHCITELDKDKDKDGEDDGEETPDEEETPDDEKCVFASDTINFEAYKNGYFLVRKDFDLI